VVVTLRTGCGGSIHFKIAPGVLGFRFAWTDSSMETPGSIVISLTEWRS